MVGNAYGRLTVLERTQNPSKWGGAKWLCRCECGKVVPILGNSLRSGNSTSCGCLRVEMFKPRTLPPGEASENRAVLQTKANAKSRGYEWALTREHAVSLMRQNCFYCDAAPAQVAISRNRNSKNYTPFFYNGLDRVDNSRGYTTNNVVPCCFVCNRAKDTMSLEKFREWVFRVSRNLEKVE